jgi:hypothetical protein
MWLRMGVLVRFFGPETSGIHHSVRLEAPRLRGRAEEVGFPLGQVDLDPESVDLEEVFEKHSHMDEDFVDVKDQVYARRALLIAAAGGHKLLTLWTIPP